MHPAAEVKERTVVTKRLYTRLKKGHGLAAAVKEVRASLVATGVTIRDKPFRPRQIKQSED